MRSLLITFALIALLATVAVNQRHALLIWLTAQPQSPPLNEASDEGPKVRWHDDYFIIEVIDPLTIAIGEPRYYQQNFSYLLLGEQRAVLFDAGPGLRDIRPIAASLTDQPITFIPSHFHYDHIGNRITFERVAVVDLPYLRERTNGNQLPLTWQEHLGQAEGFPIPTLDVDEWLAPWSTVDLGGRRLKVVHTPGHTPDSISLYDPDRAQLFSGDFIYPGPLIAFLPNSSLSDYLQAAERVLATSAEEVTIFGAHRSAPPAAPRLALTDVQDLKQLLSDIAGGRAEASGNYPAIYRVNANIELWAEPRWLQRW